MSLFEHSRPLVGAIALASLTAAPAAALDSPPQGVTAVRANQTNNSGPNGLGYLHTGSDVYVADLDGDGDNDVVTGAKPWYEGVHVGLNDGSGLSYDVTNYGNGLNDNDGVWGIDIADFDGDLDVDVVALERSAAGVWSVELYANDGSGDFSARSTLVASPPINFGDEPGNPVVLADLGHGVMDDAMVEAAAYCLEAAR